MLQDARQLRGQWKLAKVSKTMPSSDGKVRRVILEYKNEGALTLTKVERPVQRLVVIVTVDENTNDQQ